MMGYKVGDEVLVKAVINDICVGEVHPYEVKAADNPGCGSSARVIYVREEDVLPIPDMTAEETWEIARRIVGCREHGLEETKRREIFSRDDAFDVFNLFTEHEAKDFDYDMLVFFSPSGIESLTKNFPSFDQGKVAIATFGPATAKAAQDAGLRVDLEAPSKQYPSMTGALQHYLEEHKG